MNLTEALTRSIEARPDSPPEAGDPAGSYPSRRAMLLAGVETRPVFQPDYLPRAVDPADYQDARSPTNPYGDLRPLYNFHALVGQIPAFTRYYQPTSSFVSDLYDSLINGATVQEGSTYTLRLFGDAQQRFAGAALPSVDGTPTPWYPEYADPSDWYDTSIPNRFHPVKIEWGEVLKGDGPYAVIGSDSVRHQELSWRVDAESGGPATRALDPTTKLEEIAFRYAIVNVQRPWLHAELLAAQGWYLKGQRQGFFSTGDLSENDGIFPLLPTQIVVAVDATFSAAWNREDDELLNRAADGAASVSLGPFVLSRSRASNANSRPVAASFDGTTVSSPAISIIAFISRLNPLAPSVAG